MENSQTNARSIEILITLLYLQPKREQYRKATAVLAPVIDLKSKTRDIEKDDDGLHNNSLTTNNTGSIGIGSEFDWNVINEYDPMWPNEYEKVVKELRDIRDREHDQETEMRKRRRDNTRFEDTQVINKLCKIINKSNILYTILTFYLLFQATGNSTLVPPERDEERTPTSRGIAGGAAIAPPPSLQECSELPASSPSPRQPSNLGYATSSVAAKIMAKYGFKEGQGLGKKEQGMSVALQVEKTSKRGGRIVGEREQLMPPPPPVSISPPPLQQQTSQLQPLQEEPSITEIMKSPSKVIQYIYIFSHFFFLLIFFNLLLT